MTCPDQSQLEMLANAAGARLKQAAQTLATAESCTGGWVGQCLTAVAGSSAWFERGFVTYSNAAKEEMLGVPSSLIAAHGAVSEAVAAAMAAGALTHSQADWSLAITGIAGPDGGTPDKPVGTVCLAWACRNSNPLTTTQRFDGNRAEVRAQAVACALAGLLEQINGQPPCIR